MEKDTQEIIDATAEATAVEAVKAFKDSVLNLVWTAVGITIIYRFFTRK